MWFLSYVQLFTCIRTYLSEYIYYNIILRSLSVVLVKDNDAYYVYMRTHDFSLCTLKIRPVRTIYAVKVSGTQTVFSFMRTQIKYSVSQIDNFSAIFFFFFFFFFFLAAVSTIERK